MTSIRALLVDLGQVLVRFDHGLTLKRLGEATEMAPEALRAHVFGPLVHEFDLGRLSADQFFRAVERSAGLPRLPNDTWIPAWRDIFEPDHSALEALGRVRGDVRRILVSNTNALHWEGVLRVFDVRDLVDACVLSFEIGAAKPESTVFDAALSRAGEPPEAALFADDRPDYAAAARELGLSAFVVTGPGALERGLSRHGLLDPL